MQPTLGACADTSLILMGDFNSHLQGNYFLKTSDRRSVDFSKLINDNRMVSINTLPLCSGADATFVSYDGKYRSMIDHIIIPLESVDNVKSCCILDDDCLNVSSHRPIIASMLLYVHVIHHNHSPFKPYKWDAASNVELLNYQFDIDTMLCDQLLPINPVSTEIDTLYTTIVQSLNNASESQLPKSKFKKYFKPYWNKELTELHAHMKLKREVWVAEGRPRGSSYQSYSQYKDAKRAFRAYHRRVANAYLNNINAEIDRAACVNSTLFWKLFNRKRKGSAFFAGSEINFSGKILRDQEDITRAWGTYFMNLYSDTVHLSYDEVFLSK